MRHSLLHLAFLLTGLVLPALADSYKINEIHYPGSMPTLSAVGINDHGEIVGEYGENYDDAQSYLDNNGVFSTITVANGIGVTVQGINNLGQVVGSVQINGGQYAFADLNGTAIPINVFDSYDVRAAGINDSGEIVGYYNGAIGFVYKNGIATSLQFPGAEDTYASGINNSGEVVGEYLASNNQTYGFTYQDGVFKTFIDPQDPGAVPIAINDEREIIGVGTNGFGFTDIDGTFSQFPDYIQGLNNLGELVGEDQITGGFEAIPTPEPSTGVLIGGIGLLLCAKPTLRRWMIHAQNSRSQNPQIYLRAKTD